MATETFFKEIIIGEEAAKIMAAEAEKPRKLYVPKHNRAELERRTQEWLERFLSKTSPDRKENKNS